jgi:hypothetical protein
MKFKLINTQCGDAELLFEDKAEFLKYIDAFKSENGDGRVKTSNLLLAIEYLTTYHSHIRIIVERMYTSDGEKGKRKPQPVTILINKLTYDDNKFEGACEFRSVLNMENSFTSWRIADDAKSEITFEVDNNRQHAWYEWICDVDGDDEDSWDGVLEYEGMKIEGYDGLFELPQQLILLLDLAGFNTDEVS